MANPKTLSLQDDFLQKAKDARIQVTFFLVNGYQLKGIIKNFDAFTRPQWWPAAK